MKDLKHIVSLIINILALLILILGFVFIWRKIDSSKNFSLPVSFNDAEEELKQTTEMRENVLNKIDSLIERISELGCANGNKNIDEIKELIRESKTDLSNDVEISELIEQVKNSVTCLSNEKMEELQEIQTKFLEASLKREITVNNKFNQVLSLYNEDIKTFIKTKLNNIYERLENDDADLEALVYQNDERYAEIQKYLKDSDQKWQALGDFLNEIKENLSAIDTKMKTLTDYDQLASTMTSL